MYRCAIRVGVRPRGRYLFGGGTDYGAPSCGGRVSGSPELSGRPRRRLRDQVRREEPNCWLCGKWIDPSLHWNDRMAFTVDEVIPRSLHPLGARYAALDRSRCRAAHRSCNSSRGNGTRIKRTVKIIRSRVW